MFSTKKCDWQRRFAIWALCLNSFAAADLQNTIVESQPSRRKNLTAATSTPSNDVICFGNDIYRENYWQDSCENTVIDGILRDPAIPDTLIFGAGGLPVPFHYYGPAGAVSEKCEALVDLVGRTRAAESDRISKFVLLEAGFAIGNACLWPGVPFTLKPLGGHLDGLGERGHLLLTIGKKGYLPQPPGEREAKGGEVA